jgi:hypothetical protein
MLCREIRCGNHHHGLGRGRRSLPTPHLPPWKALQRRALSKRITPKLHPPRIWDSDSVFWIVPRSRIPTSTSRAGKWREFRERACAFLRESSGKGDGIGIGSEDACRGVAWWAPSASRGARPGQGSECYLATSRLSQSCECCICTRHAITDCVWAISIANTSYSFVDKYQSNVNSSDLGSGARVFRTTLNSYRGP